MKNVKEKNDVALSEIIGKQSADTFFGGGNMGSAYNTIEIMYRDAFLYGNVLGYTNNDGQGDYNMFSLSDRNHINLLYKGICKLNEVYEKYGFGHFCGENAKIEKCDADTIADLLSDIVHYGHAANYFDVLDDMVCTSLIFKYIRQDCSPDKEAIQMFYDCRHMKTLVGFLFEKMTQEKYEHRKAA